MDSKAFNKAMDIMKEKLGNAFIASSFWANIDGQPIINHDPHGAVDIGAANALFNQVTEYINESLKGANFPVQLNRYYLMDLTDNKIAIAVQLGDFQWGMLIDISQTTLGLVLNVALPEAMAIFKEKRK
jgi:hypothetical protein